jgi:hypothetical protein
MFAYFPVVVAIIIFSVVVYALRRPDTFYVNRSVVINSSPDKIFPLINDLHLWEGWTPYNKDPAMKKTFSGSANGVGALYAWEGDKNVGQGNIAIVESESPVKITLELNMIKPFAGQNKVVFSLKDVGDITTVIWRMDGKQNFMMKVMGLIINMDRMVGKDFEAGLSKLKTLAEQ